MNNGIARQRLLSAAAGLAVVLAGSGFAGDAWGDARVERLLEQLALERHGLTLAYEESRVRPDDAVVLSGVTLTPTVPLDAFEVARAEAVTITGVEERPDAAFTLEGLSMTGLTVDLGETGGLVLAEGRFDGLDASLLTWLFAEGNANLEQPFPQDARLGAFDLRGLEARVEAPDGEHDLRLARVSGEEIARGRVGNFRLEDLAWSGGAAVEGITRIDLAGLEMADVNIRAVLDEGAVPKIFERPADLRLGRGVLRRLEVERLEDTLLVEAAGWEDRVDGDGISTTRFFAESLSVPMEEVRELPYGARLGDGVSDTLRLSTDLSVVIDPARKALRIDPLRLQALDLGGLDATVAFDDFPNAVPGEKMVAAMIGARLGGARISYREDGLFQAALEQAAAERGMSPDHLRAELRETLRESDLIDAAARDAMLLFLNDPYRLTLDISPDKSPSFAELLGMVLIAPEQIRNMLNLRIHAEESP